MLFTTHALYVLSALQDVPYADIPYAIENMGLVPCRNFFPIFCTGPSLVPLPISVVLENSLPMIFATVKKVECTSW